MQSRTVTYESVQAGQPRPYADSTYEGYLTFTVPEGQMWASKFGEHVENVKPYVKLMCNHFTEEPESWENFHVGRLKLLEQVSPGRWHVIVTVAYCD
jgi:hypothetical protein